jgi:hypothetical protein
VSPSSQFAKSQQKGYDEAVKSHLPETNDPACRMSELIGIFKLTFGGLKKADKSL